MTEAEISVNSLTDLTSEEVKNAIDRGFDTVIVPLGATEQHGPHLPVDTDTAIATELAERLARRLGKTLVAPAIPVGPSDEHAAFPGTISIQCETLQTLLGDYVRSLERQGFDRIVILAGHGGSLPVVGAALPELARDAAADVVALTSLREYLDVLAEAVAATDLDVDEPDLHAGSVETAMMLAIDPDSVGDERPDGYQGPVSAAALYAEGIEAYAENGVLGDPRSATAEAGETFLEHVAQEFVSHIRDEFKEIERIRCS